jgi:hypothetical protein
MLSVIGVMISSFLLNVSQPLTLNNGWNALSAASSHCPCCKGKVCNCGMEKTQASSSSKKAQSNAPCCGKTNHFPEPQSTPILTGNAFDGNELQKNLSVSDVLVPFLESEKSQIIPPIQKVASSPGISYSFPLRI